MPSKTYDQAYEDLMMAIEDYTKFPPTPWPKPNRKLANKRQQARMRVKDLIVKFAEEYHSFMRSK